VVIEARNSTKSGAGPTDAALVIAARAGERWAQEALFERHARRALGLAQRVLGTSTDAEDVLQDAFVHALNRLHKLDNPQAFVAWLTTLVIHTAQKRLRRQRLLERLGIRTLEPIDPDTLLAPGAPPEVTSELRSLYAAVSGMPSEERIALVLRRVEGMELQEIAAHMQLSLATVKRRLKAAEIHLARLQTNA
jgi:RNA polymerase sigma-70 factor (ECF subfamily)